MKFEISFSWLKSQVKCLLAYFENDSVMNILTSTRGHSVIKLFTHTLTSYFNIVPSSQTAFVLVPHPIHIFPVDLTDKCHTLPLGHTGILKFLHNLYIPGWGKKKQERVANYYHRQLVWQHLKCKKKHLFYCKCTLSKTFEIWGFPTTITEKLLYMALTL